MQPVGASADFPRRSSSGITSAAILAALLILALGAAGNNFELTALAALTFATGVILLWRPGDTQVLLAVYLFQWLQGSMPLFQASMQGVGVDELYRRSGLYSEAVFLTHIALICFALGIRFALPALTRGGRSRTEKTLLEKPSSYWFGLYLIFFAIGNAASFASTVAPGLSQIFLGLNDLRWAFFLMLAAASFAKGGANPFFVVAFTVELILGFSGFFSDFKTVFIVSFLGLMISGAKFSARWLALAGLMAVVLAYMVVIWTVIKPEYRSFISGGVRQQVVTVPFDDRMQKLLELSTAVDKVEFSDGVDDFIARIGYIEFFGGALAHVPSVVPHEQGAILLDAASRPFTPRFFFPEKTVIDDSARTGIYTGWMISGVDVGTSISLGWIAEVYIDFGRWGMMLAAFCVGLFYGSIHRLLTLWRYSRGLLGSAAAAAILINVMFLETSITKATGGLVASVIATLLAIRIIVPMVAPYLTRRSLARDA